MKAFSGVCVLGVVVALLFAGCESIANRIQEKADVFARLGPNTQEAIKHGQIGPGFSPDMVYMALGKPSRIETSVDGIRTTWTYFYFNTPDGRFFNYAANVYQTSIEARNVLTTDPKGLPFTQVAGVEDLRNGDIKAPDATIRRKTAAEMIQGNERQDLHLKFVDGRVIGYELEIVVQ
jgi:hypothetical protein